MSVLIIFHTKNKEKRVRCNDGIIAAAIAAMHCKIEGKTWDVYGDTYREMSGELPDLAPCSDGFPDNSIGLPFTQIEYEAIDELLIVDFSYPLKWLQYWERCGLKVTVIDHHAERFGELSAFSNTVLDESKCASVLTWEHFFGSDDVPEILRYVQDRDIGDNNYYDTIKTRSYVINLGIAAILGSANKTNVPKVEAMAVFNFLCDLNAVETAYNVGEPLFEQVERIIEINIESAVNLDQRIELNGVEFPYYDVDSTLAPYASFFGSMFLRTLHEDGFDAPMVVLRSPWGNLKLRSRADLGNFDTRTVANALGGGGHRNASGVPWSDEKHKQVKVTQYGLQKWKNS